MNPFEADVFRQIPKDVRAEYESSVLSYTVPHGYKPDWTVYNNDGSCFYIEGKGFFRREDQVKMKRVVRCNPGVDIRFVFAKDNKVQGSKMLCSEWAEKYGFQYAIGKVPIEWFKDARSSNVYARPPRPRKRKSKSTRKTSRGRKA